MLVAVVADTPGLNCRMISPALDVWVKPKIEVSGEREFVANALGAIWRSSIEASPADWQATRTTAAGAMSAISERIARRPTPTKAKF
jgi:hypothetical protein